MLAAAGTTQDRSSIEIAGAIQNHPSARPSTIQSTRESVQDGFSPLPSQGRYQLEHGTVVVGTAEERRAVKAADLVEGQPASGIVPVIPSLKIMKHAFGPTTVRIGCEFEHRAARNRAAELGRTVQVAGSIEDHTRRWICAIGAASIRRALECIQ